MNTSRYRDDQMVRILREADKATVAEAARKHGVSEATIDAWRKHYNNGRPDSSPGEQSPNEFVQSLPERAQPTAILRTEPVRRNMAGHPSSLM